MKDLQDLKDLTMHDVKTRVLISQPYLTQSVFKIVVQKSIIPQICQLIVDYYLYKSLVDGFVQKLTFQTDFGNTRFEIQPSCAAHKNVP